MAGIPNISLASLMGGAESASESAANSMMKTLLGQAESEAERMASIKSKPKDIQAELDKELEAYANLLKGKQEIIDGVTQITFNLADKQSGGVLSSSLGQLDFSKTFSAGG